MQRAAWLLASMLVAATPAAAQPSIGNDTCRVTFVHAPDEVRLAIERWVAAEPQCTGQIELRVIQTENGYYLIAQRPDGRIHERLVPDVDAAGVLVASWIADPWTSEPPRPALRSGAAAHEVRLEHAVEESIEARVSSGARRWLAIGALVDLKDRGGGVRGELDVARSGWLTVGAAVSLSTPGLPLVDADTDASLPFTVNTTTFRVVPYLAASVGGARWDLRAAVGLGYEYVRSSGMGFSGGAHGATAEASLVVSRRVGERWAIATGPVAWFKEWDFREPYNGEPTYFMWMAAMRRPI